MKRATAILLLIAALPILTWIGSEIYHASSRDPEGVENYLSYVERMPKPRAAKIMNKEGNEFFVFFGPIAPLAMVSGPPAYIFNRAGMLVDWSGDIGEDPRFAESWKDLPEEEITIEKADLILRNNLSNHPEVPTP